MPFKIASGLKEILLIPSSARKDANSGKSLGACPISFYRKKVNIINSIIPPVAAGHPYPYILNPN
jgi:hypothetical protein